VLALHQLNHDDALVDLFLSSLELAVQLSIPLQATLDNQCGDGKSIPFMDMEQKFILLEEIHTLSGSSHHDSAN
jgi:hypothetical protein